MGCLILLWRTRTKRKRLSTMSTTVSRSRKSSFCSWAPQFTSISATGCRCGQGPWSINGTSRRVWSKMTLSSFSWDRTAPMKTVERSCLNPSLKRHCKWSSSKKTLQNLTASPNAPSAAMILKSQSLRLLTEDTAALLEKTEFPDTNFQRWTSYLLNRSLRWFPTRSSPVEAWWKWSVWTSSVMISRNCSGTSSFIWATTGCHMTWSCRTWIKSSLKRSKRSLKASTNIALLSSSLTPMSLGSQKTSN